MERKLYRRSGCDYTGSDMDDGSSYVQELICCMKYVRSMKKNR